MQMREIFLQIEPVAKARPRMTRSGHVYTPKKTAAFEDMLKLMIAGIASSEPMKGPIYLEITFFMRIPKRKCNHWHTSKPDLDNLIKAVCDAMNGILWHDDSQIAELKASKVYDPNQPAGAIEIRYCQTL